MIRKFPPRAPSQKNAETLLKSAGVRPTDEHYAPLLRVVSAILYTSHNHTALVNEYGWEIAGIVGGLVGETEREKLQWIAADLARLRLSPDYSVMRLIKDLVILYGRRRKSNSNLRPRKKSVTDAQILAVCGKGGTREEQARKLGLTARQLNRRLAALQR